MRLDYHLQLCMLASNKKLYLICKRFINANFMFGNIQNHRNMDYNHTKTIIKITTQKQKLQCTVFVYMYSIYSQIIILFC